MISPLMTSKIQKEKNYAKVLIIHKSQLFLYTNLYISIHSLLSKFWIQKLDHRPILVQYFFRVQKIRGRWQINSINSIGSFGKRRPRPNNQGGPIGIDLIRPNKAGAFRIGACHCQFTNARNSWRHQTAYPTVSL